MMTQDAAVSTTDEPVPALAQGTRVAGTRRANRLMRKIDALLGVPLLATLGMLRFRSAAPRELASVGIISCCALGDTIIASAIARDIKRAQPACKVIVFIAPSCRGITKVVEGFDEEVVLPITNPLAAFRVMRDHPTTALIDIMPWNRMSALLSATAPAKFVEGFRTAGMHRHFAFDACVTHSGQLHEIDNFRGLLGLLRIPSGSLPCARALHAAGEGAATIILHPWASGFRSNMREWPQHRWVELARMLARDGYRFAITGGPGDVLRSEVLAAAIGLPGQVEILAGKCNLIAIAAHLAAAAAVISVNTGTMHLAAAIDCPLIALHGPTNPDRWGPLSEKAVVIGPGPDRGGAYLNLGYEYPPDVPDCMLQISVGEVVNAVRAAIDRDRSLDEHQVGACAVVGL